jgi:Fic family protein
LLPPSDRNVDGIVEVVLDATNNYAQRLTRDRLFAWLAALFPSGYSNLIKLRVAAWRNDAHGPMQLVSGAVGRQKVHYEASPARVLNKGMNLYLSWFNARPDIDPVLKAGLAQLWFVTLHPFDDGE